MDQQFMNWVYSGILMAFGWFAKTLWDADKEIRNDLMKLRKALDALSDRCGYASTYTHIDFIENEQRKALGFSKYRLQGQHNS